MNDNLVLEHLRHIREQVDRTAEDVREIKNPLGILEEQYATISRRVDRVDERVERVEKRLELH